MKRYIKANDLWYTDSDGNKQHAFLDFGDIDGVRRTLSEIAGYDFADAFADQLAEYVSSRNSEVESMQDGAEEFIGYIDDENDDLGTALSSGVDCLRTVLNELGEHLGDEDDITNELLSRAFGFLDTADECQSGIDGGLYDLRTALGLDD